jgi:hypothetical protein
MRKSLTALVCLIVFGFAVKNYAGAPFVDAATTREAAAAAPLGDAAALTIYNRDFAVVRQGLTLDLHAGMNRVSFPDATLSLEPDSVILRDLTHRPLQVLEQNYRNDPVSQELLLSMFEGKTIDFVRFRGNSGDKEVVQGKVIRSGFVPHGGSQQPIIEVDGKLQFFLPGQPIFPALGNDTILKPTLHWLIRSDREGATPAEIAYITGGMSWDASYNIVAPEHGDTIDLVGWITMNNRTGKTFENARIKLLAGDVNRVQNLQAPRAMAMKAAMDEAAAPPPVTEKSFDEYHLYTLQNATTLRDQETKQVEFVRGAGVKSQRIYVYEGFDTSRWGWYGGGLNQDPSYGTQSNSKVWVMQEFKNSKENNLGMALPHGRVRFYRRDDDGQLQFTGENMIDHTPSDETIRLYTGNAFDVVGERKRTEFHTDSRARWFDESFEIKIRNHKKEAVQVRVVERLYRWSNWQIADASQKWNKKDAQTVEFPVNLQPDQEGVVRYTVHYSW